MDNTGNVAENSQYDIDPEMLADPDLEKTPSGGSTIARMILRISMLISPSVRDAP